MLSRACAERRAERSMNGAKWRIMCRWENVFIFVVEGLQGWGSGDRSPGLRVIRTWDLGARVWAGLGSVSCMLGSLCWGCLCVCVCLLGGGSAAQCGVLGSVFLLLLLLLLGRCYSFRIEHRTVSECYKRAVVFINCFGAAARSSSPQCKHGATSSCTPRSHRTKTPLFPTFILLTLSTTPLTFIHAWFSNKCTEFAFKKQTFSRERVCFLPPAASVPSLPAYSQPAQR